jgi:hypothetical protein
MAFYSDCVHEVAPVDSGVRVVLVLNFIRHLRYHYGSG